jgi:hypothetical protein
VDESVSSSVGDGPTGAPRPGVGPEATASPPSSPPSDRVRYRPLRGLEELLDDFLRGPAE